MHFVVDLSFLKDDTSTYRILADFVCNKETLCVHVSVCMNINIVFNAYILYVLFKTAVET